MKYQYRRDDGSVFEVNEPMSNDPLTTCPTTGQGCHRIITGGNGALLQPDKTVKYLDGRFVTSGLAKELEANPLFTTCEDKRNKINEISESNKQKNAEMVRKATGRISEI